MSMTVFLPIFSLALAACGGAGMSGNQLVSVNVNDSTGNDATVRIYKSSGAIQCAGPGISPAEMSKQLSDAGIPVLSASCGNDGMMHPAVCGAASGAINIFDIPASEVDRAKALSFAPLSNLPRALVVDCK